MSKPFVFPYGIALRESGELNIFPAVEAFFSHKNGGMISLFMVIDSGAYISALPKSDAGPFGVHLENGAPMSVSGIDGRVLNGWRHDLQVKIGEEKIMLPVVFLEESSAPRILGRLGVFDKFTIIFEEQKKRSGFLRSGNPVAKRISTILDKS